jgi:[glutamine synthetase] adenylyltransferase / [glutamine synthetase]-adenylyl-L-tyrosine phosphorylase
MKFADRISRSPRPHDPDQGAEVAGAFGDLAPELRGVLVGAGGSSPYLRSLMMRHADWLRAALARPPEAAFDDILAAVAGLDAGALAPGLRNAKAQVALLVGLCDLAGVWTLEQVTAALTRFADLAVDRGVKTLVAAEIDRAKLPGAGEADKDVAAGLCVLAMGKMGAHELNYSSDIDLICLFDETRYAPDDYADVRASFIRVTRRLCKLLGDLTGDGYVFRTDLRLRPDPSVTPVCLSMETAEWYYESVGRTWERAAHIKARACAGDIAAGQAYLTRLTPFIWRRHLDFAAIQDAHDMRLRIREHKRLAGPIQLEGHNMKLGAGGIREIEFFTQTRQIIAGGRDPDLRLRGTLAGLAMLADKGWIKAGVAAELSEDYRAHREVEHRLQMVADAQTHDLPKTPEGFARLAALAGRDVDEMRADLRTRLARVAVQTEGFFAPQTVAGGAPELSRTSREVIERWRTYPALRSSRAVQIFGRLRPEILARLQKAAHPDQALLQFDGFLSRLPAGVQVFSMFQANPQLIDLIVDIAATAPRLARYLGRNAQVFDAVIGGDFFAPWPGGDGLAHAFGAALAQVDDYEAKLDALRRVMKEWHFRIGVHHLRGLIDADAAGDQYAALAEAVLKALCPVVSGQFALKHGVAPGRGAVVLGMGSLGSGRLTAASDLDLIVIYDADGVEASDGRRPLAARLYYARLTQALVTALSAPMAEGRLYEVDMRLRPSGRQGPVATSLEAFRSYQREAAWTWEHLALTRARVVAGDSGLGAEIADFLGELLAQNGAPAKTLADVADMRARLAQAKPGQGAWDAKRGPGRMQDIELFAQTAALLAGEAARDIASQLAAGARIGWYDRAVCDALCATYALLWRLQSAARLLTGEVLDFAAIGQGGTRFVLRETGADNATALAAELERATDAAAGAIKTALGSAPDLP